MMRSIRGRVVLLVLASQLVAAVGAVGLSIWYVHRAVWSSVDSDLKARTVSVLALVDDDVKSPDGLTFDEDQVNIPKQDLFYIDDIHGGPVAGSSSWLTAKPRGQYEDESFFFRRGGVLYRARAQMNAAILDQENHQIPQLYVNVYYAMPANRAEGEIANATRIAISVGLLSLLISFGSTWWAVGKGMRPLTDFAHQADLIEADGAQFEEPAGSVRSTELVPLARALHSLVTRLQQAFRRERRFLSDAAHELKTAVAIQKSTLQLLEQGKASEEELREGIARALEDTSRTESLVANMLLLASIDYSQGSTGEGAVDNEVPLGLNESLQHAIDQLVPMAKMRSVSVVFDSRCDLRVRAPEYELNQLWINLLENAIQHSPLDGEVKVEISCIEGSGCRILLADAGSGISSEDLPHVFERFYRSDRSRSRLTGGFGLGLSIAKAIVEKNHGAIQIDNMPQTGTMVEVRLPAVDACAHHSSTE
jgi:signal transduction histidine kinase